MRMTMNRLIRLDERNREIFVDPSQINYLQLNPVSGNLTIGLSGSSSITVTNGRVVLKQLQNYLDFNEIEV